MNGCTSLDGMDEIFTAVPTEIIEIKEGKAKKYLLDPGKYGFSVNGKGSSVEENAEIMLEVLQGKTGPKREVVLLNAAACPNRGPKSGEHSRKGISQAQISIDSGAAFGKLADLRELSRHYVEEEY